MPGPPIGRFSAERPIVLRRLQRYAAEIDRSIMLTAEYRWTSMWQAVRVNDANCA
jgi:hypothetical protein